MVLVCVFAMSVANCACLAVAVVLHSTAPAKVSVPDTTRRERRTEKASGTVLRRGHAAGPHQYPAAHLRPIQNDLMVVDKQLATGHPPIGGRHETGCRETNG